MDVTGAGGAEIKLSMDLVFDEGGIASSMCKGLVFKQAIPKKKQWTILVS